MKPSIAITLIVIAAVFCFVSGYSIGSHSNQASNYRMASQANNGTNSANAAEKPASPSGGYGAPDSEKTSDSGGASPGYGAPSPGYGQ
jgi:hypothetical protein